MMKSLLYKVVYPTEHFGKKQVQENNSLEASTLLHSVSESIKQSNAANDRKADAAHRVGTNP